MGLFDLYRHPDQQDQTEIVRAIAHNETRGDGDAVPDTWREAAAAGIATFDEAADGGWLGDLHEGEPERDLHGDRPRGGLFGWREE
jgi:hypothetical protein